jgi:hypothetical protein
VTTLSRFRPLQIIVVPMEERQRIIAHGTDIPYSDEDAYSLNLNYYTKFLQTESDRLFVQDIKSRLKVIEFGYKGSLRVTGKMYLVLTRGYRLYIWIKPNLCRPLESITF